MRRVVKGVIPVHVCGVLVYVSCTRFDTNIATETNSLEPLVGTSADTFITILLLTVVCIQFRSISFGDLES